MRCEADAEAMAVGKGRAENGAAWMAKNGPVWLVGGKGGGKEGRKCGRKRRIIGIDEW